MAAPFLTDVDSRAEVKGSRDPLGLVPIWSKLGREVVGNLSTVTNTVRGFTTLILGLHFADEILEIERGEGQTRLDLFLKFEQLAGYVRVKVHHDRNVRGLRRVQARLGEGRIPISAAPSEQILANQKVYGLWGLFSMPGRASELLEKGEQRLTLSARDFVTRHYVPYFTNGKGIRPFLDLLRREEFDFEPEGRHRAFAEALARCHARKLREDEKDFYRRHLAWGGDLDSTQGKQRQLAEILTAIQSDEFGFSEFHEVKKRVARLRGADALTASLDRIEALERLLSPARVVFGYLLTQDSRSIDEIAAAISKVWKRAPRLDRTLLTTLQPDISRATGSESIASGWMGIAEAMQAGDYLALVRRLIDMNTAVMQARHGSAAWLAAENNRLRVRMADETEELLPITEVENLWRSTYFINSLWMIAGETA